MTERRGRPRPAGPRRDPRALAVEALVRIDGGAYANLLLPHLLDRSGLSPLDRRFATDLVYGTTRMARACDWLVDRFLLRPPDPAVRAALRLGAYQLQFLRTPAHAAVSATVAVAPPRAKGLVNAVLRRVADAGRPEDEGSPQGWPSDAVRLSYPDWIVERLCDDLGRPDALGALETMNEAPPVTTRADGYVQDRASQWVVDAVDVQAGDTVADLCAAPGGKATALVTAGPRLVVAADVSEGRAGLIAANARRLSADHLSIVVSDGAAPALRPGAFDRVLVDAPCSGLGVLRRRPDARWRVTPDDVDELVDLQRRLLTAAAGLVRPGGVLAYSVCTLTAAETVEADTWTASSLPDFTGSPPGRDGRAASPEAGGPSWRPLGRGGLVLPQDAGTDGMFVLVLRRER